MGLFESFYGDIICPGCGHEYKHYTPSIDEMRDYYTSYIKSMTGGAKSVLGGSLRKFWIEDAGFKTAEEWYAYLKSEKFLEEKRQSPWWGLAEVQTKDLPDLCCASHYVGDEVPSAPQGDCAVVGGFWCKQEGCKYHQDVLIRLRKQKFVGIELAVTEEGSSPIPIALLKAHTPEPGISYGAPYSDVATLECSCGDQLQNGYLFHLAELADS